MEFVLRVDTVMFLKICWLIHIVRYRTLEKQSCQGNNPKIQATKATLQTRESDHDHKKEQPRHEAHHHQKDRDAHKSESLSRAAPVVHSHK